MDIFCRYCGRSHGVPMCTAETLQVVSGEPKHGVLPVVTPHLVSDKESITFDEWVAKREAFFGVLKKPEKPKFDRKAAMAHARQFRRKKSEIRLDDPSKVDQ
jgi:hypothetical protein